ncbi:hypothetical protein M9434_000218 [Picochlorum sp. BPE23]|nr:hypothetical protein M9434_000218 [Picochlorum sp. BPE23]KAI8106248.1 hypothetical protein M9435_000794 [Picochlorum sp. BPE23]
MNQDNDTQRELVGDEKQVSKLDGQAPESTDFANYFCTYSYLYHQKDMLEDHKRTGAYFDACMKNHKVFQDKVVLDVGTGSGILAIFAAKAGARRVYAVEATDMAKFAKRIVHAQGFGDTIEVIQGVIESVEIPEKVDIIISEWMGYFLLRESMLDSVLVARDRFLKPEGALYPSHARLYMAPIRTNLTSQRSFAFMNSMENWASFVSDMHNYYGVDLDCLSEDFRKEQMEYYKSTASWADVHPSQVIGEAALIKSYDLKTVTLEELKAPLKSTFTMKITDHGSIEGFVGYFDTDFRGSPQSPADLPVVLSTAPDEAGATHWGQQVFQVHPNIACSPGDSLECTFEMRRRKDNHRLLLIQMQYMLCSSRTERPNEYKVQYVIE